MNRKGGTPIVLLVFIILILLLATLFNLMINSRNLQETVLDSSFLDSVYAKESEIKFFVRDIAEQALIDSSDPPTRRT